MHTPLDFLLFNAEFLPTLAREFVKPALQCFALLGRQLGPWRMLRPKEGLRLGDRGHAGTAGSAIDDQAMLGINIAVSEVPGGKQRLDGTMAAVMRTSTLC